MPHRTYAAPLRARYSRPRRQSSSSIARVRTRARLQRSTTSPVRQRRPLHHVARRTRPFGRAASKQPTIGRPPGTTEWRTADLYLVSCVSVNRPSPTLARELYTSPWFKKARSCVEEMGCPWYILSAKYGLLNPNSTIAPYNETLKTMPTIRRRAWARGVIEDLAPHTVGINSVTLFAGMAYREFLGPALRERGLTVYVPMEGMAIGQQLSWLSKQARS